MSGGGGGGGAGRLDKMELNDLSIAYWIFTKRLLDIAYFSQHQIQ